MLIKQCTKLTISLESRKIEGVSKIDYLLSGASTIRLHAKQLTVKYITLNKDTVVSYDYACPSKQANALKSVLSGISDSTAILKTRRSLWEYEQEKGGFLTIFVPETYGRVSITIHYYIEDPIAGIKIFQHKGTHIVHTESGLEHTRLWMPCKDNFRSKYPITIEYWVPQPYIAVSTGNLCAKFQKSGFNVLQYEHENAYIDDIGFCVGAFQNIIDDSEHLTYFALEKSQQLRITTKNNLFSILSIMENISEILGQEFPFSTYKIAFLPLTGNHKFAGFSIIDTKYMIEKRFHEGNEKTMRKLVDVISYNWIGASAKCNQLSDLWILKSLSYYFQDQYLAMVAKHPYLVKFRIQKTMQTHCEAVRRGLETRPLCTDIFATPNDIFNDKVLAGKEKLIFYMISSSIGTNSLNDVIKLLYSSLSTENLIAFIENRSQSQFTEFARYWIYGIGAPMFECSFYDNRETNYLEISITESPIIESYLRSQELNQIPLRLNMLRYYTGPIKIEILESNGSQTRNFKVTMRLENGRGYKQVPLKMRSKKNASTFSWASVDPNFEIIREIKINVSEHIWINQLSKEETDPLQQTEAIKALVSTDDTPTVSDLLYNIIIDPEYFYKVRETAAKVLCDMSKPTNGFEPSRKLFVYFEEKYSSDSLDLANISEYRVNKAIVKALSRVRDELIMHEYSERPVNSYSFCEFLFKMIRREDFSVHWRSHLFEALASVRNPRFIRDVHCEVKRALDIDKEFGYPHFTVSKKCLFGFKTYCDFSFGHENIYKHHPMIQLYNIQSLVLHCVQMKKPLSSVLSFVANIILSQPQYACLYIKSFWNILHKMTQLRLDPIETERLDEMLLAFIASPFAFISHKLSDSVSAIYNYLHPISHNGEPDPVWEDFFSN